MKRYVAYGSLYMDEGEGFKDTIVPQLKSILKPKNVVALLFDVLGYEEQKIEGEELVEKIKDEAYRLRPDLEKISVAFSVPTGNDKPRN